MRLLLGLVDSDIGDIPIGLGEFGGIASNKDGALLLASDSRASIVPGSVTKITYWMSEARI